MDILFRLHTTTLPPGGEALLKKKIHPLTRLIHPIKDVTVELNNTRHHRKGSFIVELTLHLLAPSNQPIRASAQANDLQEALDVAIESLKKAIQTYKGKNVESVRRKQKLTKESRLTESKKK